MDRSEFLKGSALGAAGIGLLGTVGMGSAIARADEAPFDMETGVVVVGAGNGGLSAAAALVGLGRPVVLLEVSAQLGGGAIWSGGVLHSGNVGSFDAYCERSYNNAVNAGNLALEQAYVETFVGSYIPWLQEIGIPLTDVGAEAGVPRWTFGDPDNEGSMYERAQTYFDALAAYIEENGGTIMPSTRAVSLITDDAKVAGVFAENVLDGSTLRIKADDVVLACGGLQANKGLLAQFMGKGALSSHNMGTPYNTGSGLLMAVEAGAKMAGNPTGFSGGYCLACPPGIDEYDALSYEAHRAEGFSFDQGKTVYGSWVNLYSATGAPGGIDTFFFNLEGRRFADENDGVVNRYSILPQKVMQQPGGVAVIVMDAEAYGDGALPWDIAVEVGIKTVTADTLEEFAQGLHDAYGMPKGTFLREVTAYNEAFANDATDMLDVPRSDCNRAFEMGPFYALPIACSIYYTFAGLDINENAQVMRLDGRPFPNLYACPPTAAMFSEVYFGGNAVAGTFGYIAAHHIAAKG